MSLIPLLGLAWAGSVVHTAEPVPVGAPLDADQLYAVELPAELHPDGVIDGPARSLVGRTPRFDLPAHTPLREVHLFPAGTTRTAEGLALPGHTNAAVEPPEPSTPLGSPVDLWVHTADRWCLAADRLLVTGHRDQALLVGVPDPIHQALVLPAAHTAVVFRAHGDQEPSPGPRCEEAR